VFLDIIIIFETSRKFFPNICTTHTYDDKITAIKNAQSAGLEVCGGGIIGLGENIEDRIELTDIIKHLNLYVIIVSSSGLGSINDAVLTVEYARNQDINVKGIILNKFEYDNLLHIDNKKMIEYLTGISVVGCVHKDDKDLNIPVDVLCKLYEEV